MLIYLHNVCLGSYGTAWMKIVWKDVLFCKFLSAQKKVPDEATLTLVHFDHEYEVVHNGVNILEVPPLTKETFVPPIHL